MPRSVLRTVRDAATFIGFALTMAVTLAIGLLPSTDNPHAPLSVLVIAAAALACFIIAHAADLTGGAR